MSEENLNINWSLKELYSSFSSECFINDMNLLKQKTQNLISWGKNNLISTSNAMNKLETYIKLTMDYKILATRLHAFSSLSLASNGNDITAKKHLETLDKLSADLTRFHVKFSNWLSSLYDLYSIIECSDLLKEHRFYLNDLVRRNKYLLSEKEEFIISKMKLTGSTSWENLRNSLTSNHTVDITIDNKNLNLNINKVKNMLFSNDANLRKTSFFAEIKSNEGIARTIASCLNGIKGEVLATCELKGYKSPLFQTLENSRMDEKTLETMLNVIKNNLKIFHPYYIKKAKLLNHNKLAYYDIMAPIGNYDSRFSYDEAKKFISSTFSTFSKEMSSLAIKAFDNNWIDASIKDGKRGGAFCSNLYSIKESRILCNFDGSFKNVCTLAHELGHAYHGSILQKESILNSSYPMPLAETASLFAENIVRNSALENATNEEALSILGAELINCNQVIVDIYARYTFEKKIFDLRKKSEVPLEQIKFLMLEAQKEAYGEEICSETFDPYAWIHKPHYYFTERNFYNFPYAFGLLFAKGLYNMYLKEGSSFVSKYNHILKLTGQSNVYDVANYVGIDLHDESFWLNSIELIKKDIDRFCNL